MPRTPEVSSAVAQSDDHRPGLSHLGDFRVDENGAEEYSPQEELKIPSVIT
jgi:hypothetical protein